MIDILDIDEDVLEIGVFDGETCIGAVVVQDSCEQVLIYPDSSSTGAPYQFQVVAGRSMAPIENYRVYRDEEGVFLAGEFGSSEPYAYHCVRLGDRGEAQSLAPACLEVHSNYPNPFNPETTISYSLPAKTNVRISIYNVRGQLVRTLVNDEQEAGDHFVIWNGRDGNERSCASGVYFYRVKAGSQQRTHKMLLLK